MRVNADGFASIRLKGDTARLLEVMALAEHRSLASMATLLIHQEYERRAGLVALSTGSSDADHPLPATTDDIERASLRAWLDYAHAQGLAPLGKFACDDFFAGFHAALSVPHLNADRHS